jgi:hypothetical protein
MNNINDSNHARVPHFATTQKSGVGSQIIRAKSSRQTLWDSLGTSNIDARMTKKLFPTPTTLALQVDITSWT